jgi:hypothetical protein
MRRALDEIVTAKSDLSQLLTDPDDEDAPKSDDEDAPESDDEA